MNRSDEIKHVLAEATQRAYERGWNDAIAEFRRAAAEGSFMQAPITADAPPLSNTLFVLPPEANHRRRGRPNASIQKVATVIAAAPGETGARIVAMLPDIHERTIRTALRRLRLEGRIEQRSGGGWFAVSAGDR